MPAFAGRQVDPGACGITCQKLGKAEVMADAGLDDILISYPLLGFAKALRFVGPLPDTNTRPFAIAAWECCRAGVTAPL